MRSDTCTVFHPQYYHSGSKTSLKDYVDRIPGSKIVLTSKGLPERKAAPRKPVKECYCHCDTKNTKPPVIETSFPCDRCNNSEIIEIYSSAHSDAARNSLASSLLGHETLTKAGKITYLPTSEFLRRLQKKVSHQKRKKPIPSRSDFSLGSSLGDSSSRFNKISGNGESPTELSCPGRINEISPIRCNDNKERHESRKKISVPTKCTRSTSLSVHDRRATRKYKARDINPDAASIQKSGGTSKKNSRSSENMREEKPKNKRIVRTISARNQCCSRDDFVASKNLNQPPGKIDQGDKTDTRVVCGCGTREYPKIHDDNVSRVTRSCICLRVEDSDQDRVRELSKFRQANYFETHGSIHTLVGSSRSSGSIDCCRFNDRLFLKPRCSAKHIKRIHYFPTCIVREDKIPDGVYCRKKRRDTSGHIIDLGILEIPCKVSDSLTFRYQR